MLASLVSIILISETSSVIRCFLIISNLEKCGRGNERDTANKMIRIETETRNLLITHKKMPPIKSCKLYCNCHDCFDIKFTIIKAFTHSETEIAVIFQKKTIIVEVFVHIFF